MSLVEAIKNKEDVIWEDNNFTWLDYRLRAKKEAYIFDAAIMGKLPPAEELNNALARRKKRADWRSIRWLLHAREGVDLKSRLPKFQIARYEDKERLVDYYCITTEFRGGLIPRTEIFFPWEDIEYRENDRKLKVIN
jgi:hypothetical protein